jgi:hypothetical protein
MADQTPTQKNPNAPQSGNTPSGHDKSNPTSQSGQPNEMPDRGKTDGSKGDQFDRKPTQASGADAMKNEGGAQSSSTLQNKGMGEDEKGSAERKTPETERR